VYQGLGQIRNQADGSHLKDCHKASATVLVVRWFSHEKNHVSLPICASARQLPKERPMSSRPNPECSVIIATNGGLPFLHQAVHSALSQTFTDIEVIVVENGSRDGTVEYLRSIRDPRLVALFHDNALGATGACNTGLRAAQGKWRGFLHHDDVWAPNKIMAQLDAASRTGHDWVYSGCVYIDPVGRVVGGLPPPSPEKVIERSLRRYAVPGGMSSMIWRKEALDQGGLLDPAITYMVDWDLSLRLLQHGPPAAVLKPLVGYRQHGANLSLTAANLIPNELALMEKKYAAMLQGLSMDLAFNYRIAGSEFLRAGMRGHAAAWFWRAVRRGDWGALARVPALFLPQWTFPFLRRALLSDRAWIREAEEWLAIRSSENRYTDAGGTEA
jgi:glycosyltransferase involved in cell wall biosynthesis